MSKSQLAKLTSPRLRSVYRRTRLFERIKLAQQSYPALWVSAPAGSGKTTLIASYLQAHSLKSLWYSIDEGDADPASFFYHLGILGKQAAPRKKSTLPLLTPEYLPNLPTFTRNYFRNLYERIIAPGVIVFDNFNDANIEMPLHELLYLAISELPDNLHIIFCSRYDPPSSYARQLASNVITCIDFNDIALTDDEAIGVAETQLGNKSIDTDHVLRMREQTLGWVSGLILYLQQHAFSPAETDQLQFDPQKLFNYFAREIFQRADFQTQQLLLRTSFLQSISIDAASRLSDNSQAKNILDRLTEFNYFTIKHAAKQGNYEYHPLFREFLQNQAKETLDASELKIIQQETAQQLIVDGDYESAANLFITLQNSTQLTKLITTQAQLMLETGKWKTLLRWCQGVPAGLLSEQPWLLFWLGMCYLAIRPVDARKYFEQAYFQFKEQGDVAGLLLSWISIVDSYIYEWRCLTPLDQWIQEAQSFSQDMINALPKTIRDKYICGIFCALMYRKTGDSQLETLADEVMKIIHESKDLHLRIKIGPTFLMYYTWFNGDMRKGKQVFNALQYIGENKSMPPLVLTTWNFIASGYSWMVADTERSIAYADDGLQIGVESGVHVWDVSTNMQAICATLFKKDKVTAKSYLKRMQKSLDMDRYVDVAIYYYMAAWYSRCHEDIQTAYDHAIRSLEYIRKSGLVMYELYIMTMVARCLIQMGDYDEADNLLKSVYEQSMELNTYTMQLGYWLTKAELLKKLDDWENCVNSIRQAFALARKHNFVVFTLETDDVDWMCAIALDEGIETEYVRYIIKKYRIYCPEGRQSDNWPYAVKVYALGRFSLLIDGESQALSGKSAARPLELLKCLISLGGQEVAQEKLIEALWPEMEGDSGSKAFHTTLYRLRKLIKHEEAITLKDGLLSLDPRYVWVDMWAFERTMSRLEQACKQDTEPDEIDRLSQLLWQYYKGPFLSNEKDQLWSLTYRDRLQLRLQRLLMTLGVYWLNQSQHENAITAYEQILEHDNLHEPAYQKLMQLYLSQGRHAEVAATYERCRKVLSTVLGVMPSEQTVALYNAMPLRN